MDVRLHPAESDRLDSLASYEVLDTGREASFDALTALAARVCRAPLAAVSLVDADRQWFKSTYGLAADQTPRGESFCSDAVAAGAPLLVGDAMTHPRYRDNPAVTGEPHVRAYAGVPLVGRDGLPLGALCVIDRRPRRFSAGQVDMLTALAGQVVALLEQHRHDRGRGLHSPDVAGPARDPRRLRRALDDGELVAHYQPLVAVGSGRCFQLEALLRWQHPQLGVLPPAAFLPAVEAGSLVVPVGRAVLDAALTEFTGLRRGGVDLPGGVAVNVASGQLARPGLAADVLTALERHAVPARQLTVEITESTALPNPDLARAELGELSAAGVGIAIDDYGVGWSNLTRILDLPADTLKLDRSIAGSVLNDPRAAAMLTATLTLADTLGLQVVAEGVETEPVRRHLAGAGCRWAQGWLFAGPVPPAHLPRLLRRLGVHQPTGTGVGSHPIPTHPLHAVPDQPARPAAGSR